MTESRSLMLGIEGGHRGVGRQELQEETSGDIICSLSWLLFVILTTDTNVETSNCTCVVYYIQR